MTIAKARARAKARAAAKLANPISVKEAKTESKQKIGQFDAKSNFMRNFGSRANIKSAAAMRRGAARSR